MAQYTYDLETALRNPTKVVYLYLHFTDNLDISGLSELQNLEYLHLTGFVGEQIPSCIKQLPKLRKLHLSRFAQEIPEFIYQLTQLTALSLEHSHLKSIKPQIGNLQNLAQLSLKNTKIKVLPPEIGELKNLKHLDLENLPIESLPETIGQLEMLRKLILTNTQIKQLPLNFALLNLENAHFGFTPFYNSLGQNSRKIVPLLQYFQKKQISSELRKVYLQIFLGKFELAETLGSFAEILTGLNAEHLGLRQQTLDYLHQKNTNLFLQKPDNQLLTLFVAGTSNLSDWEGIQATLEEKNFRFATRLDAKVDWIVLGDKPQKLLKLALDTQKPLLAIGHLLAYYQDIANYYLAKNDDETRQLAQNLAGLLRSPEVPNQQLGLEMALGGGINEIYLYDILLLYLWNPNTSIKNLAERVIQKFMPEQVYIHLKANCRSWYAQAAEASMYLYLKNLEIEQIDADNLGLHFYRSHQIGAKYCLGFPQGFVEVCRKLIHNRVLPLADYQLEHLEANIRLFPALKVLYLQNNRLQTLPNTLAELQNLQTLNLMRNSFPDFPAIVCELQNLEDFNFSSNRLADLPEEIGNLSHLKYLHLSRNKLSRLPESLFQLPRLKYLDIRNNPLHKKIAEIKKRMPQCQVLF
ncbi:MAG: leucine-rich repeat domain-containing protein [Microscillaceae bacterium]|jgi:Leucine-rich repeat (LRR) protein|nr:leucine-rich repeat domain-containing protein [Microscillaceae bacterium]